jgi:hypothetical protein
MAAARKEEGKGVLQTKLYKCTVSTPKRIEIYHHSLLSTRLLSTEIPFPFPFTAITTAATYLRKINQTVTPNPPTTTAATAATKAPLPIPILFMMAPFVMLPPFPLGDPVKNVPLTPVEFMHSLPCRSAASAVKIMSAH